MQLSESAASSVTSKVIWIVLLSALSIAAPAQTIKTVAGNGAIAYSGDAGLATSAALNHPRGIAADAAGNIYVADVDNARIRKIDAKTGLITTVAGNGTASYSGDGGPAIAASLNGPQAVAIDVSGNLIIADTQNRRIRRVDASGNITTIAGTGTEGYSGDGGPATQAMLHQVVDFAVDVYGNIYFADSTGQRIRKIATNGIITTAAGNGSEGFGGDGGSALTAQMDFPLGVAVDGYGNLYIADANNFRIRMVNSGGVISTVAGNGQAGFAGDGGSATSAAMKYTYGVRVDPGGRLFIADASNNRVRMVSNGIISTLAGTGSEGYSGDGGAATTASLNFPWSIGLDPGGNVYIGDRVNSVVREVAMSLTASPTMYANGLVNGASFTPATSANGAVAPGSIVSIFGQNMAQGDAFSPITPLSTTLWDTSVTVNGVVVPLYYVANGQINAQIPFETAAGTAQVQIHRGAQFGLAQNVQIVPVAPGIFTTNSQGTGDGAFLHADYKAVTASNPAQAGETILIYCTGLGGTNPAVVSGAAAPPGLTAAVFTPTVMIGGKAAPVSYAGLAPGFVGLYQINAAVPSGLPSGSQQVMVTSNGVQGNITTVSTK